MTAETIGQITVERLAASAGLGATRIVGLPDGWSVVFEVEAHWRVLTAKRGATRRFVKFETLVAYLKKLGIVQFQVDATQCDPSANKLARPRRDAAERMKRAHEAVARERRFQVQLEQGAAQFKDRAQ
jgi:hypothetical protein